MTAGGATWGWVVFAVVEGLLLLFAWAMWRMGNEAADLRLTDLHVAVAGGRHGVEELRLLHLSDLHWGGARFDIERVVAVAQEFEPQAILLTGDLVEPTHAGTFDLEPFARLAQIAPAFYVYGNAEHRNEDQYGPLHERFAEVGLRQLDNSHQTIAAGGWRVVVAGVDDQRRGRPDLDAALADMPVADLFVLLSHAPTLWPECVGRPVDLMLSGHTHGGQVRLPIIGPMYSHSMAERLVMAGLFRLPDSRHGEPEALYGHDEVVASGRARARHHHGEAPLLFVTRGLGTVLFHGRFRCPPEAVRITVTAAADDDRAVRGEEDRTTEA